MPGPPAPTQSSLLQSLLSAADAAQQAYLAAQAANPGADLSQLYLAEIKAQNLYFDALNKTFNNDPAVTSVETNLAAATQAIQAELKTITNITTWATLVGNVVQLATTVASFFA
jgi:hypothetical protein